MDKIMETDDSTVAVRIAALQEKLAYNVARSDIEIYCAERGNHWYDTKAISDPEITPIVAESVEYLKATGRLTEHPRYSHWVRLVHN